MKTVLSLNVPAREMAGTFAGRVVELAGSLALMLGVFPRLAAFALYALLCPRPSSHIPSWLAAGMRAFMGQLIDLSENVAIWGAVFFNGTGNQPGSPGTHHNG
jgi:uncharacterized membrane protein YphA (DoxX/SURF4 family)